MPICVFAYTPPDPEPPFINLSRMESGDYRVVMRSEIRDGIGIAPTSQMTLSRELVIELYQSIRRDTMKTDVQPI